MPHLGRRRVLCVCVCVGGCILNLRDTSIKLGLTLQCMEEIVDCVLVERQGFFVLLFVICLCGLLDQLDGFLSGDNVALSLPVLCVGLTSTHFKPHSPP